VAVTQVLASEPYGAYSIRMSKATGAEAARKHLPDILDRAAKGETTVVTRRGRPVAAVVPIDSTTSQGVRGPSLLSLRGSGKGLWGRDPAAVIANGRRTWR
jgi:prevent-host-death family protein